MILHSIVFKNIETCLKLWFRQFNLFFAWVLHKRCNRITRGSWRENVALQAFILRVTLFDNSIAKCDQLIEEKDEFIWMRILLTKWLFYETFTLGRSRSDLNVGEPSGLIANRSCLDASQQSQGSEHSRICSESDEHYGNMWSRRSVDILHGQYRTDSSLQYPIEREIIHSKSLRQQYPGRWSFLFRIHRQYKWWYIHVHTNFASKGILNDPSDFKEFWLPISSYFRFSK